MTHTSISAIVRPVTAAMLTFGLTLSVGYSLGTTYIEAPGESIYTASVLRSAAARRAARMGTGSTVKVIRIGKKKVTIQKPRTRTSTGAEAYQASSKAPNVPIKASCGDKLILKGLGEECDDGNVIKGDGCSDTCKLEAGFSCSGMPTVCNARCGDGTVTSAEKCDDGNVDGGDGCSGACKIEFGYVCSGSPSTCEPTPYCGDGVKASAEQCDDGNSEHGDGCYACKTE